MDIVDVALPCRLVGLRVVLGPDGGLTRFEQLVLRALDAGVNRVDDLARFFGMEQQQILLDLVHGLWTRGHVVVDSRSGRVEAVQQVHEAVTSGTLDTLVSGATAVERWLVLHEPVTGRMFPGKVGDKSVPDGTIAIDRLEGDEYPDLGTGELLRVVQSMIDAEERMGLRRKVLHAGFGSPELRPAGDFRWLRLQTQVRVDPDTDELRVRVVDDRIPTRDHRERLASRLNILAATSPQLECVRALRGRAVTELAEPEALPQLAHRFRDLVAKLRHVEVSQIPLQQREMRRLVGQIRTQLVDRAARRARVTPVVGVAGHRWIVDDLIARARRQVVLVAPRLGYEAYAAMAPALEAALRRHVQVVLVWGKRHETRLEPRVRNALNELYGTYGDRLLYADAGAGVNARFVVQDDQRALLTSSDLFAVRTTNNAAQLGVLVEPPVDEARSFVPVEALLRWAYDHFPNGAAAQAILHRSEDFGDPEGPPPVEMEPDIPPVPDDVTGLDDAQGLWAESWRQFCDAVVRLIESQPADLPVVEVLYEGSHGDRLQAALRSAGRTLSLVAERLGPRGVSKTLVRLLNERTAAGTTVSLRYDSVGPHNGEEVRKQLDRLDGVDVGSMRSNVRALVADDEVLVTSVDLLAREAPRDTDIERPAELGLAVEGRAFAIGVCQALRLPGAPVMDEPYPPRPGEEVGEGDGDDAPAATAEEATPTSEATALALLVDAGSGRTPAQFGRWLRERLPTIPEPWGVLDAWLDGLRPDHLRVAAATMLAHAPAPPEAEQARWVDWLVVDAWRRRAFMEAALVVGLAPEAVELLVPRPLVVAAGALDAGPLGETMSEAALTLADLPPDEDRVPVLWAGLAAALAEMLLHGSDDGREAVHLLRAELAGELPPGWSALTGAALTYAIPVPVAVPLADLRAEIGTEQAAEQARSSWEELHRLVEDLRRRRSRLRFRRGQRMHDALFARDGLMGRIERAADGTEAELEALAALLPDDTRRYLDDLVARAGEKPIDWSRQLASYLEAVDRVVDRARRLCVGAAGPAGPVGQGPRISPGVRDALAQLGTALDEVHADALGEAVGASLYEPVLMGLLDRLGVVRQWSGLVWP